MSRRPARPGETGAALLTVLILVGVLGALTVAVLDRLKLATLLEGNAAGIDNVRALAAMGETLATTRLDDLTAASPGKTTLAGGWLGRDIALPLPGGRAVARVSDAGNCFNLNSLVTGVAPDGLTTRPLAVEQFAALMRETGIGEADARRLAAAAADWIDSDDTPNPGGAEDPAYARSAAPYRTAGTLMAEPSELRAVTGITPALYARLRPWLCALPVAELSPLNVNTLLPEQWPLLAMLWPPGVVSRGGLERALAERPRAGWASSNEFWNTPALRGLDPPADALRQPVVASVWFGLDLTVVTGDRDFRETALVDARLAPARIAARRWTREE